MDWKALLAELKSRGWTQQLLASRIDCSQAAISDLNCGNTANPTYRLGKALESLHESGDRPEEVKA
jgi:transcriptional regulator with XRE-family HTH domain